MGMGSFSGPDKAAGHGLFESSADPLFIVATKRQIET